MTIVVVVVNEQTNRIELLWWCWCQKKMNINKEVNNNKK
jgi:hypothetical protein